MSEHKKQNTQLVHRKKGKVLSPPKAGNRGKGVLTSAQLSHLRLLCDKFHSERDEKKRKSKYTAEDDLAFRDGITGASAIFINPNIRYEFRLCYSGTLSSTGAGSIATAFTFDPSGMVEFSTYLSFMFNEVRIRHAKLRIVPINTSQSAAGIQPAFFLSSDLGFTATAPTSAAAVIDNPDSQIHPSVNIPCGQGGEGWFTIERNIPADYTWALCTAPAPGINQGCFGQFQAYHADVFAFTKPWCSYLFEGIYEFRSRT